MKPPTSNCLSLLLCFLQLLGGLLQWGFKIHWIFGPRKRWDVCFPTDWPICSLNSPRFSSSIVKATTGFSCCGCGQWHHHLDHGQPDGRPGSPLVGIYSVLEDGTPLDFERMGHETSWDVFSILADQKGSEQFREFDLYTLETH